MDFQTGQRVRISDSAFSDGLGERKYRGQLATVVKVLSETFGPDPFWNNGAIVQTDDRSDHYVTIDELEPAPKEDPTPSVRLVIDVAS